MVKLLKLKKIKSTSFKHSNNFSSNKLIKESNKFKDKIRDRNPFFLKFKISSSFIYESKLCFRYISKIKNNNKLKPTSPEILLLNEEINLLNNNYIINDEEKTIEVLPVIKELFNKMKKIDATLNDVDIKIKNILLEYNEPNIISIKKIRQIFYVQNGYYISASKINNILRRKLNYHYLKTAIKNINLTKKRYIIMSFFYLKIFLRGLKKKANYIFIDEAGFYISNPNSKIWRMSNKEFYYNVNNKDKVNLIMGVNKEKIVHFELIKENINSEIFLKFMNSLYEKLTENEKLNSIIVMDNLACHLTKNLFAFYNDKKLKLLFNVPYLSSFNMIEICFRSLKNITNKKLFKNLSELNNELKRLIEGNYLKQLLPKLFKETLNKYLEYINNNKSINLN